MEILLAIFGKAPEYFDVTSRIKQDVIDGRLKKDYTWKDLGDPFPGEEKELRIEYSHAGNIIFRVFPEASRGGLMSVDIPVI